MFFFPWNWDNVAYFLRCRNSTIYRASLMNELSSVCNTITSLKQNDLLNVILYGRKNFDSNNNQSMKRTKTLIAIAIKVYSPQPSNSGKTKHELRVTSCEFKSTSYEFKFTSCALHENCPNTEFFLVRIFLYYGWILKNFPVFGLNTDQKKLRIRTLFTQWRVQIHELD